MTVKLTEKDYLAAIKAAYTIHTQVELWDAMTQLAILYVEQGWTQEAADILAFVLLQCGVPLDIYEQAFEAFDDLERSICPRVIWDARDFARDMDTDTMIAYLLDDFPS